MTGRLADRLARGREERFAGRKAQCAAFAALLDQGTGAVVVVHGTGGIGKSVLLHRFAALGAAAGRTPVWYTPDRKPADQVNPSDPPHPANAANAANPANPANPAKPVEQTGAGQLVLIDVEPPAAQGIEALFEDLLPALAADAIVVVAGREEPPLAWRVDPAWQGVLHQMPLGPLDIDERRELLERRQVPPVAHAEIVAAAGGHPLALALAADLWRQRGDRPVRLKDSPQVVRELLSRLLEQVPSPAHRMALEVSAQVLTTSEPLLAHVLEVPDARDVFDWLCDLSAFRAGRLGLTPHDLVRQALDAELRWRAPERRREINRRAAAYYQQFFDSGDRARQQSVLTDFAFLHRDSQAVAAVLAPPLGGGPEESERPAAAELERLGVRAATPQDLPLLEAMVRRFEGSDSARWWQAACAGSGSETLVVHDVHDPGDAPVGFSTTITLRHQDMAQPGSGPADPALAAARGWLLDPDGGDLRPGEEALLVRHWMSRDHHQTPSAVQLLMTLRLTHRYLLRNRPALTLIPFADPDAWHDGCRYADFTRAPGADFTVGGRGHGVFVHDWRRTPPLTWLTLLTARHDAEDPWSVTAPEPVPAARLLSHEDFATGVLEALRGLRRAGGLADTALLRSRMVAEGTDPTDPTHPVDPARPADAARAIGVLRDIVLEAAAQLRDSPPDRNAYRALHHTYLQPAGSQQRAAELLRLPMTTYRRHLAKGVARMTELLWQRETAAPVAAPDAPEPGPVGS